MSMLFVPKELIKEYARKVSANALMIYLCLLDSEDYDWEYNNMSIAVVNKKAIEEFTGIAPNKQNKYIDELKEAHLIYELEEYEMNDFIDDILLLPYDKIYGIKITYENCTGGFIEVPNEILKLNVIELDGETKVSLKSQHKVLFILHMILSERSGFSYAGRKYLADTLGVSERTVTNLNNTLEQAGLMRKVAELIPLGNEGVKTNNKYYLAFKPFSFDDNTNKKEWYKFYDKFYDEQHKLRTKRENNEKTKKEHEEKMEYFRNNPEEYEKYLEELRQIGFVFTEDGGAYFAV